MSGGIVGVGAPDPGTGELINRLANPPNPVANLGPMVNTIDALKTLQAQNALTGIYQQSIDPTTGQVDLGKFNALARQNPAALYKFGDTMHSAGGGVGAEGVGTSAAVNAQLDQLAVQQAYMTPLLPAAKAGTLTADDVRAALKNMPPGVINPTTAANINQALDDGANASQLVLGGFLASDHARATIGATTPNMFGYGGGAINVNPLSPGSRSVSDVPFTPTPGEQISYQQFLKQPHSWYDPKTLQYYQGTYEQFLNARGANPNLQWKGPPPPAQGGPTAPQPAGGAPEPSGKVEPAPPAAAPGGGGDGGGGAPKPGAAGQPAAVPPESTLGSATDQYNAAVADLPNSQKRVLAEQQAEQALRSATTGHDVAVVTAVNNLLSSWSPAFLQKVIPGYDPEAKATSRDVAEKYLQQIANATSIGSGATTNEKLNAAVTANPNLNVTNKAALEVLGNLQSQERMGQVMTQEAIKQNVAPAAFAKWRAQWVATHDPRAFLPMTPELKDYLSKNIKPGSQEEKTFMKSYNEAQQNSPEAPAGQD